MTIRFSTGARNALAGHCGFASLFQGGSISIYTGTQPASADSAATGTLLGVISTSSGTLTAEVLATGSITITGGSTSVTTATVGGVDIIKAAVPYNTSTTQTATDLCEAINLFGIYTATVSGAVVTLRPRPGVGANNNGDVVTTTGSVTATYSNMSGGTNQINGIQFTSPVAGVVNKSGVWSFNGVAAGTAGWFRMHGAVADADAAAPPHFPRVDGSVATSGADLNLSNIVIAIGAPSTCDSFTYTQPA